MKERCFEEIIYYGYVDKELAAGEMESIGKHLSQCNHCRDFVEQIREENLALGHALTMQEPAWNMEAIMDSLETQKHRDRPHWRLAAAAVILLGFLVFLFLFIDRKNMVPGPQDRVVVRSAQVQGQEVQTHIFNSKESNATYIWLAKQDW